MTDKHPKVLILGSAPSAMAARDWPRGPFSHVLAINNAWRIRDDWDILVHPEDFPVENRPRRTERSQRIVSAKEYVPAQNKYGGFVYAGGTMAFTAGYWALAALHPAVLAYLGCDMVYPKSGKSHFYGRGTADPLRPDVTLRSLEAKSARLALMGAGQGCHVVRLSSGHSRLAFPSVSKDDLSAAGLPDANGMQRALSAEAKIDYSVPSGRYWEVEERFDPNVIDRLDRLWLSTYKAAIPDQAVCSVLS